MFRLIFGLVFFPLFACSDKPADDSSPGGDSSPGADSDPADDSRPDSEPVDADADGFTSDLDCDDNNNAVNPSATEVCDGVDNDCDGTRDQDAQDASTFYADADGDGFASERITVQGCEAPEGFFAEATDCDDLDATVNPSATEVCDGVDNDCDSLTDGDDDSADLSSTADWYLDDDGDGYGDDAVSQKACSQPEGYVLDSGDCDDEDAALSPSAEETCDGSDNNCDGLVDDDDPSLGSSASVTWYADADGDGFGAARYYRNACSQPSGYVDNSDDCDDLNAETYPGATEICDGEDDNCDALVDDDDPNVDLSTGSTFYLDGDGDSYGLDSGSLLACDMPSGYAAVGGDCDDTLAASNPGGTEICNTGIDEDCSGDGNACGVSGTVLVDDADYTFTGTSGSNLGYEVSHGDFDGDGYQDLMLGAYYNDAGSASDAGRVAVIYGPVTGDLAVPTDYDVAFDGVVSYDYCSKAFSGNGDLDGDGNDDLAMGCYGYDPSSKSAAGAVGIQYGSSTRMSGPVGLTSMSAVFVGGTSSDYLGDAVRFVGDLNGDGYDELVLGADGSDVGGSSAGAIYIITGSSTRYSGTLAASSALVTLTGTTSSDYVGNLRSVAGPIDLDGDGLGDLVFGGYGYDGGASSAGGAFLVYGYSGILGVSVTLSASLSDAVFTGAAASDYLGEQPNSAGDVDGDGYEDLVVGADGVDSGSTYSVGCAYLLPGSATRYKSKLAVASYAVATMCNSADYGYQGEATGGADLNGDGFSDVVVGAYGQDYGTVTSAGAVLVYYGPLSGTRASSSADAVVQGTSSSDYAGKAFDTFDGDGDGADDLLVGGHYTDTIWLLVGGGL